MLELYATVPGTEDDGLDLSIYMFEYQYQYQGLSP